MKLAIGPSLPTSWRISNYRRHSGTRSSAMTCPWKEDWDSPVNFLYGAFGVERHLPGRFASSGGLLQQSSQADGEIVPIYEKYFIY